MIGNILKKDIEFLQEDGYYVILKDGFNSRLNTFLENHYAAFPVNKPVGMNYDNLPYDVRGNDKFEWQFRVESLKMLESLRLNLSGKRIVQFGPWNNWLSHHLKREDNELVCLDYFIDETGGLRSKKHFRNNNWFSVQCDLEDISFFSVKFDVIVINHSLQFFSDPVSFLENLIPYCNEKAKIICLGAPFFRRDENKRMAVENTKKLHLQKYGYDLLFTPSKGYLNLKDKSRMEALGFSSVPYDGFWMRNLYSRFNLSKPFYLMMIKSC